MKRLPAIVADIDGVITRGEKVIPGTKEALVKVLDSVGSDRQKARVPFMFLTNGGSYTEKRKAEKMNTQIGLDERITADMVV